MDDGNPTEDERLARGDFEHLIGEPLDDVAKLEPGYYCRARRVDRDAEPLAFAGYCMQRAGYKTEHVGEGRCHLHGGASPRGRDSPHFEHGIFSDHMNDEDREAMEILEGYSNAEKLQEAINFRLVKVRRAQEYLHDEDDDRNFWDAFDEVVRAATESPDGLESSDIRELGNMLSSGQQALQNELDLIRRMILAHSKITEGETLNVNNDMSFDGDASLSVEWNEVEESDVE